MVIYEVGCHDAAKLPEIVSAFVNQGIPAIEKLERRKFDKVLYFDVSGNEAINNALRKAGFIFQGPGNPIMLHALSNSFTSLIDHKKWNLTLADGDSP